MNIRILKCANSSCKLCMQTPLSLMLNTHVLITHRHLAASASQARAAWSSTPRTAACATPRPDHAHVHADNLRIICPTRPRVRVLRSVFAVFSSLLVLGMCLVLHANQPSGYAYCACWGLRKTTRYFSATKMLCDSVWHEFRGPERTLNVAAPTADVERLPAASSGKQTPRGGGGGPRLAGMVAWCVSHDGDDRRMDRPKLEPLSESQSHPESWSAKKFDRAVFQLQTAIPLGAPCWNSRSFLLDRSSAYSAF